ncbi:MAG: HNH endonuclease [Planctomycetaceae bacterium]|nr:HNH endonuclease [Planctomycetaceae bacterium]
MPTAPRRFQSRPPAPRIDARPPSNIRGYGHQHALWSERVRDRDCHLCQDCKAEGRLLPGTIADHIVPRHIRPDLAYTDSNGRTLCARHHSLKTASDTKRYGSASATVLTLSQQQARREAQR